MIKAVLLSRLAMTQDSIRNTHTQMIDFKNNNENNSNKILDVLTTKITLLYVRVDISHT